MNTFFALLLDDRRPKKDGTFPIIFRLTHFRKTTSISSGYSINKAQWDEQKKEIRSSYKGVSYVGRLNNILLKERTTGLDIIHKLHDKGELNYLSIQEVKEKIIRKSKFESFFNFGESKIKELRESQRFGTARSYKGLLGILKVITNQNDLKFNELNYEFLKRFESFHMSKKGNTINGLASYMRVLKAIYNKGIKEGIIEKEAYPFDKYKIRTTPTEKRSIDLFHIKRILELNLKKENTLFHYRNYFLISYMLYGMSFIDMAFLKINNIVDGRIKFQRKKTSKLYDIKITDQLQETLKFYTRKKKREDYIFPIIKRNTLELQYKDIDWARKRYNIGLKKIAALCGIEQHITSYVSRHSFATQAMFQNIPLQAISTMLGHSKLNTTQIYLKSLPSSILDEYNDQLKII